MNNQPTSQNEEQLTEDLINQAKTNAILFEVPKDESTQEVFKMIQSVSSIPKASVPMANFERVKNQILDRIAIPAEEKSTFLSSFFQYIPTSVRIGGGIIGTFLILISLTIGTAIAAIQSVPGQPIYPLKKVVENIQLRLAHDENDKTTLQIKFANNRLEELETVLQKNQEGKVNSADVQRLVEKTVRDITNTATRVSQSSTTSPQPQVQILSKLVDLSNKQTNLLQAASVNSEGEIKLELEKALETSIASQEQTIEDIEKAGLKVENTTITIDDKSTPDTVEARGKLTTVRNGYINIGTAKFLLTEETKFVNITQDELKEDQLVSIKGIVDDSRTFAVEVKLEGSVEGAETPEVEPPPPPPVNDPDQTIEIPDTDSSGQ